MRKNIISLSLMLILLLLPLSTHAQEDIKISINENFISSDVSPVIENGRTLVPIRIIAENFGYDVKWYEETKMIHIGYFKPVNNAELKDDRIFNTFHMTLDNPVIDVNNAKTGTFDKVTLDVSPKIINGRTMVPIRFIAENMGLSVEWDASTQTVIINGNID
ncbi:copper amine oxidase N-terminal domain-containing protein [Peptoniphilus asaccharolyticus]